MWELLSGGFWLPGGPDMDLQEIYRPVADELELVEERLPRLTHSRSKRIAAAIAAMLGTRGKRLRPALLLIAAKACNYTGERAVNLAVAIGVVYRRGFPVRPTAKPGVEKALLVRLPLTC